MALGQDIKATIDAPIAAMLAAHNAIWQVKTNQKIVYLTFDEGYEYGENTSTILDIALEKNVKFTFFITGSYLSNRPDLVLRMVNEGHVVANHSYNHLRAPDVLAGSSESPATLAGSNPGPASLIQSNEAFVNDIMQLAMEYQAVIGQAMAPLYRPPEGAYSERSLAIAEDLGYQTVFWSFAYRDWLTDAQPEVGAALAKIMDELHPGSILLLHAVSDTNVTILPKLLDQIRARGYSLGLLGG